MGKQEGADAHGPAGSRTQRGHGGDDAWKDGKRVVKPTDFDEDMAARHRQVHQDRQAGKKP